jgi:hypothetical protein
LEACAGVEPSSSFLPFQLVLQLAGFAQGAEVALPDQSPRSAVFGPLGNSIVVVFKPLEDIFRNSNVKSALFVLDDVDSVEHLQKENPQCLHTAGLKLVAGTGFEPVTFRL